MKINVTNLKYELNNYNKLVEDYEEIYLNMYNEYSNCSFFWYDNNAKNFFNDINIQKVNITETISELTSLSEVYNFLAESYEKLGKEIYYDLSSEAEIKDNINNYISSLQSIIRKYSYLNLKNCPEVYRYITDEKEKLNNALSSSKKLYSSVEKFYKKVEEIEKEAKIRASRIKIDYLTENNISDYV